MDKSFKENFMYTVSFISPRIRKAIEELNETTIENIHEIRLRKNKPVVIVSKGDSSFLTMNSKTTYILSNNCIFTNENELIDTFNKMCGYSMHTQSENIANGFITLKNGSRIGLAGSAVYEETSLKTVKDINSLNIRIPRNINNSSNVIFENIFKYDIKNLIISGPPNSGKTTILKDIAYQLSSGRLGKYYKVCIIDERHELSSKDFSGPNTDILSGFQKDKGIIMALRTLSPDVIICDEISDIAEVNRIISGFHSGVNFILSLHASNVDELKLKESFKVLSKSGGFNTVAFLSDKNKPGQITSIYKVETQNYENDFIKYDIDNEFFDIKSFNESYQKTHTSNQTICLDA